MIGGRRPLPGRKPADRRVRVDRPHSPYFRYTGRGQMVAKAAAHEPKTGLGRIWARVRKVAIGRPLASEEEIGERLSKKKALAIFSSDAISSSAYATEEILRVLVLAGAGAALVFSLRVAIAVSILLAVVALSYQQVCRAYPSGGGAYSVSKENLGRNASLPDLPHFAPTAKRIIYLHQSGAPSQIDLFDYKPKLSALSGSELPDSIRQGQRITGMTSGQNSLPVAPSIFKFARHGESGTWISELLPHTAKIVDNISIVKTVNTDAINHDPAITFIQTGFVQPGRPSMGAWVSYGE